MEDKLSRYSNVSPGKRQIHLYVPECLHKEVRIAAAEKGVSMMQFCITAVLEQLLQIKTNKPKGPQNVT